MRILIDELEGRAGEDDLSDEDLVALYRPRRTPWWRVNMVSSLDGAATGPGGRSGGINNGVDKRVFDTVRGLADAVVVGAGTARAERYGEAGVPLVLVSRRGEVPEPLRGASPGAVLMATTPGAEALEQTRDLLGADQVLALGGGGGGEVDLAALRRALAERGLVSVLCEGGPSLFDAMVGAGVLDEVCLTVVPRLLGGSHPRIVTGPDLDAGLRLTTLLEEDGTLLGRWAVEQA